MEKSSKIFVAGHRGLVGSAIVKNLQLEGYQNLILRPKEELDLTDAAAVDSFFRENTPEYLFLAAAKVGGIIANSTYPADFIEINLAIQNSVIPAARRYGLKRLIFLGSSCIYPKLAEQPLKEESLLSGYLEPSNEAYAVAKIAGIIQCRGSNKQYGTKYLAAMPTNLYGDNDNFDLNNSHVLPALIRKFHEAGIAGEKSVTVWGSGKPMREFLHADDLAQALLFLANLPDADYERLLNDPKAPALINIGSGEEISIRNLAELVKKIVGFNGDIIFDADKPDGTPRKILDVTKMAGLGWKRKITLEDGIVSAYRWYQKNNN